METQDRWHCGNMQIFVEMARARHLQAHQLLVVSSPKAALVSAEHLGSL